MNSYIVPQRTIEGATIKGYSPIGVKGYPYLIPCEYVAVARKSDGLLTWRAESVGSRSYGRGNVPSSWVRQGTRRQDDRPIGIHGRPCP